ncbi:unnamed protein product, partial [Strongylus vulgaris]
MDEASFVMNTQVSTAGENVASCEMEINQKEIESETVSVIIEPSEALAQVDVKVFDKNNVVTSTVLVDVIPHKEHKSTLTTSDSWEKEFVVASGSAPPEAATRLSPNMDLEMSAANSLLNEVEKLEDEAK